MHALYCGCVLCEVDADGRVLLSEGAARTIGLNDDRAELFVSAHEHEQCLVGYRRRHLRVIRSRTERRRLADESAGRDPREHHARMRRVFGIVEPAPRCTRGIQISETMRHWGRIGAVALIVGVGDHFEIWNPDMAVASQDPHFRELAAWQLKLFRRHPQRAGSRREGTPRKGGR